MRKHIINLIDNCLSKYPAGSKEFCNCARGLTILHELNYFKAEQQIWDKFLIDNVYYDNLGNYLTFLINYLKLFGVQDNIKNILENIIQNQIYNESLRNKKYIEEEIYIIKQYAICDRLINRIIAQIRNEKEPYILYKHNDYDISGDMFEIMHKNIFNYKQYNF